MALFRDRRAAGRALGEYLKSADERGLRSPVVVALPRGGVVVGYEVARALGAPLEVAVVRKIGAPGNPEFGIGAVAEDDVLWVDSRTAAAINVDPSELERELQAQLDRVQEGVRKFRGNRLPFDVSGRDVVIVDDGLATGVTAVAAARLMRARGAARVVLAVPVGSREGARFARAEVDELVCLEKPSPFYSVGEWYESFEQVSDSEAVHLLALAHARRMGADVLTESIAVPGNHFGLPAELSIPRARESGLEEPMHGLVIFAHGSGSSRLSPRNRRVAMELAQSGFATLLFDLLTSEEAEDRELVFDIPILAKRLFKVTEWARREPRLAELPIGYFGASTGAGAALVAAAHAANPVAAVVSRGGRPDLAGDALSKVRAPTLLIVGGDDEPVIHLNERAMRALPNAEIIIVPGATHLFEEPGALEAVSQYAIRFFGAHLKGNRAIRAA